MQEVFFRSKRKPNKEKLSYPGETSSIFKSITLTAEFACMSRKYLHIKSSLMVEVDGGILLFCL